MYVCGHARSREDALREGVCVCSEFALEIVDLYDCNQNLKKVRVETSRNVMQCVAVCCSVLQCVAVCCGVLPCVAMCCHVLQCGEVCCSVCCSVL